MEIMKENYVVITSGGTARTILTSRVKEIKRNETIVHTAKVHCSYRSRIFKSELRGAK